MVCAQQDYKGKITDKNTGFPLPYVNIGIVNKGIGTVSNESGVFHLKLNPDDFTERDTLVFSSIGYTSIRTAVPDLDFTFNDYPKFIMMPEIMELREVVVTDSGAFEIEDIVGYQNSGEKMFGYWKDNIALGGELATKIKVKKGLRKLNNLLFEVWDNPSDSVLIRVNFYDDYGYKPKSDKNLNTSGKSILYTIGSDTRYVNINLKPFDIYVRNDFIVSLELLQVYGSEDIGLIIAASKNRNTDSYRKYASQDKWEIIDNTAMAYYLNTTLFSKKELSNSKIERSRKRNKQQSIISGMVFFAGKGIANVKVTNYTTGKESRTDAKGRYLLYAEKGHILGYESEGMKKIMIKVGKKPFINLIMEPE